MKFTTCIETCGNASELINFYKEVFQLTDVAVYKYSDLPNTPEEYHDYVAHCQLNIEESSIIIEDNLEMDCNDFKNYSIFITDNDITKMKKYFELLSNDGVILHPFSETSFSIGYGYIADKFGVKWQFYTSTDT